MKLSLILLLPFTLFLSGCSVMSSIFTPSRVEDAAVLAACVVPMLERGEPIDHVVEVCGPDALKFIIGYRKASAKAAHNP